MEDSGSDRLGRLSMSLIGIVTVGNRLWDYLQDIPQEVAYCYQKQVQARGPHQPCTSRAGVKQENPYW